MYGQHEKRHREAQYSNPLKRQSTSRKQRQLLLLKKNARQTANALQTASFIKQT